MLVSGGYALSSDHFPCGRWLTSFPAVIVPVREAHLCASNASFAPFSESWGLANRETCRTHSQESQVHPINPGSSLQTSFLDMQKV
jgi:hypothetical protein